MVDQHVEGGNSPEEIQSFLPGGLLNPLVELLHRTGL